MRTVHFYASSKLTLNLHHDSNDYVIRYETGDTPETRISWLYQITKGLTHALSMASKAPFRIKIGETDPIIVQKVSLYCLTELDMDIAELLLTRVTLGPISLPLDFNERVFNVALTATDLTCKLTLTGIPMIGFLSTDVLTTASPKHHRPRTKSFFTPFPPPIAATDEDASPRATATVAAAAAVLAATDPELATSPSPSRRTG